MARIVLTTFGSAGDLNPMLALGLGLRDRGHEVIFACEANFRPAVVALGFTVRPLAGDSVTAIAPYATQMFGSDNPITSIRLLLQHYLLPTLPDKIRDLRETCAGADLLVSTAIHFSAAAVADLTGIPWASIAFTPVVLPSASIETQPQPFALPPALGRLVNRLSWGLGGAVMRRLADALVNRIRASFGLAPQHDVLWLGSLSSRLTCLACSPALQPPAPDWPASVRMTGFCYWDTPTGWAPSPDLTTFLDDPAPVVAVTAGSVASGVEETFAFTYRASIEAIRRAGARALLIGAPASALVGDARDVLALPSVPYSYAFPHCAAVIHHGGIGTTAQCLRYGVPSLVVPWGFDQYYAAGRVARIGAGCAISRTRYTADRAAAAVASLLCDPRYPPTMRAIRDQIAREDGVGSLCAALEEVLAAP